MFKRLLLISLSFANMLSITAFSIQSADSSGRLSKNITRLIFFLFYNGQLTSTTETYVSQFHIYLRSFAHIFLFLVLGVLLHCTLKSFGLRLPHMYAFLICFLYAIFDEGLQELLNQGRAFQLVDLLKDWSGSLAGIICTHIIYTHKSAKN